MKGLVVRCKRGLGWYWIAGLGLGLGMEGMKRKASVLMIRIADRNGVHRLDGVTVGLADNPIGSEPISNADHDPAFASSPASSSWPFHLHRHPPAQPAPRRHTPSIHIEVHIASPQCQLPLRINSPSHIPLSFSFTLPVPFTRPNTDSHRDSHSTTTPQPPCRTNRRINLVEHQRTRPSSMARPRAEEDDNGC